MERTMILRWMLALAMLSLAGCASYDGHSLKSGVDGAPEVQALMGPPFETWPNASGGTTWEYPRGPYGRETYLVHLGPDGKLHSIEQALNEQNFARLHIGKTTQDEVHHLIGRPDSEAFYARRNEHDWLYHYRNGTILMKLYVTFNDQGMVKEVAEMLDQHSVPGMN